jgi:hemolysin D
MNAPQMLPPTEAVAQGKGPTQASNQPKQPPKPKGWRRFIPIPATLQMQREDQEFLPAALEILEQPASPIRIALIWLVCAAAVVGLLWSWFGHVDIHAVAQGRIQPGGRSKVLQTLEPGRVVAINVVNGSRVKAGDVLIELDATETGADKETMAAELDNASAEAAHRRTALAILASGGGGRLSSRTISYPSAVGPAARNREQQALDADIGKLSSAVASLQSQLQERRAQQQRLQSSLVERDKLLKLLTERASIAQKMLEAEAGARVAVMDAIQEQQKEAATIASERGQLIELDAAISSLRAKVSETLSEFKDMQTTKLNEAERRAEKASQEVIKTRSKDSRTRLVAPISGAVQQLAVTTQGQVVNSSQPLLMLVPADNVLEVEALVLNRDVGFIRPGQEVTIKVEAFPFTRFGTLDGTVVRVSEDAIDEREAAGLSDPSNATKTPNASVLSPTPKVQNLVFPATIKLAKNTISMGGKEVPLSPGMAVTVEIKTGDRRVLDYLLSPIREVGSEAIRER